AKGRLDSTQLRCGRAQNDVHPATRILRMRNVKFRLGFGGQRFMMRICHYPDNLERSRFVILLIENDALTNGITTSQKATNKSFVNDDNWQRVLRVVQIRVAASKQRRFHGMKITGGDSQMRRYRVISACKRWLSGHGK